MVVYGTAAAGFEVVDRSAFAQILSAHRAARTIRTYGRLGSFGRSLITVDGVRVVYRAWTSKPACNLHFSGGL